MFVIDCTNGIWRQQEDGRYAHEAGIHVASIEYIEGMGETRRYSDLGRRVYCLETHEGKRITDFLCAKELLREYWEVEKENVQAKVLNPDGTFDIVVRINEFRED